MQIISTNTFLRCTNERWWRKTWQVGYFFAQKGSNCSTQSRKRSQTRAVESPEWFDCVEKRKIRAIRPRSCSFFSHRHIDDAVSRERRHPSSSNRDLWDDRSSEKGAIFVTTTRYRLLRATSTRYTFRFVVVLLFRRFMQSRRWFEIEDGFEIAVTRCEMTCMHLWQRDRMHFIPYRMRETSGFNLASRSPRSELELKYFLRNLSRVFSHSCKNSKERLAMIIVFAFRSRTRIIQGSSVILSFPLSATCNNKLTLIWNYVILFNDASRMMLLLIINSNTWLAKYK